MYFSEDQFKAMIPFASKSNLEAYYLPLQAALREYQINTPMRIAAFMAQISHESGSLQYSEEIASGSAYEHRDDLGNLRPEALKAAHAQGTTTGKFYKGRGLIQITGYYNYKECGKALGLDLVNHPELLCTIENACRSACWFWNVHGLNDMADVGMFGATTKKINGGFNGAPERLGNYARCKRILGCAV